MLDLRGGELRSDKLGRGRSCVGEDPLLYAGPPKLFLYLAHGMLIVDTAAGIANKVTCGGRNFSPESFNMSRLSISARRTTKRQRKLTVNAVPSREPSSISVLHCSEEEPLRPAIQKEAEFDRGGLEIFNEHVNLWHPCQVSWISQDLVY